MRSAAVGVAVTLSHLDGVSASKQQNLLPLARVADEAGAAQIVLSEHVVLAKVISGHPGVRPGDPPSGSFFPSDEEYPDPLVALAAIAAVTTRARLSTNILLAPLRPAVLLAKMVATLDVISGGRLDLGVGSGWHREEFEALDVPFRHLAERTEDSIAACRVLWAGGPSSFKSSTVSFSDIYCSPTPVQSRIPVFFGGQPSEATAARVAKLGDGWSPIGGTTPAEVELGIGLIRRAADALGRNPEELKVRCSLPLRRRTEGRPQLADTLAETRAFVDAGADIVQLPPLRSFIDASSTDPIAAVKAVIAQAVEVVGNVESAQRITTF
jgi:probable F420-dependent oxidoreductase